MSAPERREGGVVDEARIARVRSLERPHPNLFWLYLVRSCAGLFVQPLVFLPLYFKYHTLRYKLDDEGVSASWGILFRREVYLTYKRIQDIHVTRGLVERWLGIATVQVQTAAGSAGAELEIVGVDDHEAVRDFLYRRMRGHEGVAAGGAAAGAGTGTGTDTVTDTVTEGGGEGGAEVVALLRGIREDLDATRRALEERRPLA